jgi:4-methoxybenzoate monooxygenase (O-demethylating)
LPGPLRRLGETQWERPDELERGHIRVWHGHSRLRRQMVSRLEADALPAALAARVASIEITGEAIYRGSSGLQVQQ